MIRKSLNANAKDKGEGTHQTGHWYKFLTERELESCRLLILCAGRPSFTRVSPKQWNRPIIGIFRWQSPYEDEQAWEKLWETPVIEFEFFACLVNEITRLLSSYVKISWLLWLHYKSCLLYQKNVQVVWHFSGVYIINWTLHDHLEIWNFSSGVEK